MTPHYIEDRVMLLEKFARDTQEAVNGLFQLVGNLLDREQADAQLRLDQLGIKKRAYLASKKKAALGRSLKKPKRKRVQRKRALVRR